LYGYINPNPGAPANATSLVGQKSIYENPEQICYKLLFALIYYIGYVAYPIQNPHSVITWD